ncbi:MAG: tetratricopeptide repeat protein [Lachnospiraceae bacterium]|nr:tetratricopeptide repeat protein [Lachnospiraceae bacterium]
MDVREMFHILQIEETKDKNEIKTAYRRLLQQTNPEDDPEGFKQLRQAYEEAMRYADRPVESEAVVKPQDTSPVGLWLARAEEIYGSWQRRLDPTQWQELFKDDICQALDLAEEVQEKFLVFLMSHFRLPHEVWQLCDKEFGIVEQRQQLLEKFPRDYIQYICFEIENGGFMDFGLFEGPDDGAYDPYINLYLQIKQLMDQCAAAGLWEDEKVRQMAEQADQMLTQLEAMEVYHPYGDVERLRLAVKAGRQDEVRERIQMLSWGEAADNIYVMLQVGAAWESLEEMEPAREVYAKLLERQTDNYPAGVGMMHCEMVAAQWTQAKERIMDLMDVAKNDPHLMDCMHECNKHLIPEMEARLKEDPSDWNERVELGWCLFQEERSDDCIALLHELPVTEEMRIEYCNMLSRTYLMRKEYQLSMPLLEEWQKLMYELPDSDDPKIKKRKRRIGYSYYAMAFCLQETGRAEEAIAYYDKAIALEKDEDMLQSYLMGKAHMLCTILHRYEESAETCDQLLERNEQYMPAYVCRQECSYRMHRAQAVIDDYHRAVSIYPVFLPPYLMAAKVFFFYRQYKNALDVIGKARDMGLTSAELDYYEARALRYMAEKKEDLDRPKELLSSVLVQLQKEAEEKAEKEKAPGEDEMLLGADPVEEAEVWKELAFCYMDEKNWDMAMQTAMDGLQKFPDDSGLVYAKAGTLKGLGKYKEAEPLYQQLLTDQPDNTVIMGHLLDCLNELDRKNELESLCEKILATDPDNTRALYRLMHLYQDRMNDKRDSSWFAPALELADKLVRLQPTAYYYIERGLLLSDMYRLEDAIDDYKKAAQEEPDNLYAYNNAGVNCQHLDRFEEAEEYFKKSIALLGEEDESVLPWKNLAVLYLIQQRYEEAWDCVAENEKLFPDRASLYMDRAEILEKSGQFGEAIREYERFLEKKDSKSRRAKVNIANVYDIKGDTKTAQKCFKKLLKEFPGDRWIENQWIDFMLEEQVDLRTAYSILKKRLLADPAKDGKANLYDLVQMVEVCYYLKRQKEREQYYARALQAIQQCGPAGEESYVGLEPTAPSYLYHLGLLHLFGGSLDLAEQMFGRMKQGHRCEFCHYGGCYEAWRGMALVRLMQERFDEAQELFEKALKINPYDGVSRYYLTHTKEFRKKK